MALDVQELEALSLLALKRLPRVGNARAKLLFEKYFSQAGAEESEYFQCFQFLVSHKYGEIRDAPEIWLSYKDRMYANKRRGITAVPVSADGYPRRLRSIGDAPAVLFAKGSLRPLDAPSAVAVIGTRDASSFAETVARECGQIAAKSGTVVISGLALGCDTWAHRGCLSGNGIGIAVMAHGLDMVYPAANRELADRLVAAGGCLVSEYPVATKPNRWAFAYRDRIQSGLADGIFVVETPLADGTMHTVEYAKKQKRTIACAVPEDVDYEQSRFAGNVQLLKERSTVSISSQHDFHRYIKLLKNTATESGSSKSVRQLTLEGFT